MSILVVLIVLRYCMWSQFCPPPRERQYFCLVCRHSRLYVECSSVLKGNTYKTAIAPQGYRNIISYPLLVIPRPGSHTSLTRTSISSATALARSSAASSVMQGDVCSCPTWSYSCSCPISGVDAWLCLFSHASPQPNEHFPSMRVPPSLELHYCGIQPACYRMDPNQSSIY